jgi:hypothetical protein
MLLQENTVIQGLVSKPELNGTMCKKLVMDSATGRWLVQCPDGTQMKLKAENLTTVTLSPTAITTEA